MCTDEAETAGLESGDLIVLYNDVKAYVRKHADAVETLLEEVAVAYEEDVTEGVTDEIGMKVLSVIGNHSATIFESLDGIEDPFESEEQIYHQKAVAAAILDMLVEVGVVKLPEEPAGSDEEEDQDGSGNSESE